MTYKIRDRAVDYRGITHASIETDFFAVTACGLMGLWRDVAMSRGLSTWPGRRART